MGDGEKMGKSKKRKEYSLKKIVLMVFACSSLLCLLLIIFVTRISMKAMRESKMETSLKATLEEVNQGFESEYNVLLRLSQTMTSNGLVGEKYDAYRTAEEQYDKILEYQDFYQTLNVATWEMEDVMLGAYLIQGERFCFPRTAQRRRHSSRKHCRSWLIREKLHIIPFIKATTV